MPKEAFYVGMAGVLPYLGTSLSTAYCAWEINHAAVTGAGFLLSERTAELGLHLLEPLQVGYGAVVSTLCSKHKNQMLTRYRSSPSLVPFTGDWNGQAMVATKATAATELVSLLQPLLGPRCCSLWSTP